jgi:hypothetical protein
MKESEFDRGVQMNAKGSADIPVYKNVKWSADRNVRAPLHLDVGTWKSGFF